MFETVLERVLSKYFGEFLEGISKENLSVGVFSGKISIENVSFKKEAINRHNLPFTLMHSRVEKLDANIPWKNLTGSPVTVLLSGVYLDMAIKDHTEWELIDTWSEETRRQMLEIACETVVEKIMAEDKKQKNDDPGYTEKLVRRIVDNLQVTLENIHVRIENEPDNYALGVCLKSLQIFTTNPEGEKIFLDRTDKKEKVDDVIHKRLELTDLSVYLTPNDTYILNEPDSDKAIDYLRDTLPTATQFDTNTEFILRPSSLVATACVKDNEEDLSRPKIDLTIDLKSFDLELSQVQFQDILVTLEYVEEFQRKNVMKGLEIQQKVIADTLGKQYPEVAQDFMIPREAKEEMMRDFRLIYIKMRKNEEVIEEEKIRFGTIIQSIELTELYKWGERVTSELVYADQKNQKENKKGLWGWFGSKKAPTEEDKILVSEEEKQKMKEFIEANFDDDTQLGTVLTLPVDYCHTRIKFSLGVLSVSLRHSVTNIAASLKFIHLHADVSLLEKGVRVESFMNDISTESCEVNPTTKLFQNSKKVLSKLELLNHRQQSEASNNSHFLKLSLALNEPELSPNDAMSLDFISQPLQMIYAYHFLDFISSFALSAPNAKLKTQAWEQVDTIKNNSKQSLNQTIHKERNTIIKIEVAAPVVLVPIDPRLGGDGALWVFDLGLLSLESMNYPTEERDMFYNSFGVRLQKVNMLYVDSLTCWQDFVAVKSEEHESAAMESVFHMVNNFDIQLEMGFLKDQSKMNEMTAVKFVGSMTPLSVNMLPERYADLLKIQDSLLISTIGETPEQQKERLLREAVVFGECQRRNETYKYWSPFYTIVSGTWIYFYQHLNDHRYDQRYYLPAAKIREPTEESEIPFGVILNSKHGRCVLNFEDQETKQQWKKLLNDTIEELSIHMSKEQEADSSDSESQEKKMDIVNVEVDIAIDGIQARVLDRNKTTLALGEISALTMSLKGRAEDADIQFQLKELSVSYPGEGDKVHLLVSSKHAEGQPLISCQIRTTTTDSPLYDGCDNDINFIFGNLQIVWYSTRVGQIMDYFAKPLEAIDQKTKKEEEIKLSRAIIVDPLRCLMRLNFTLDSIDLLFKHEAYDKDLARVAFSRSTVNYTQRNDRAEVRGSLGNLSIEDLTGYPSVDMAVLTAEPVELLGLRSEEDSMVDLSVTIFSKDSAEFVDRIETKLEIKMNSVKMVFYQQPVLRLVDYMMVEIIAVFQRDDTQKNSQQDFSGKTVPPIDEESTFVSVSAVLENPMIMVYPHPGAEEFIALNLGVVRVQSAREECTGRIKQDTSIPRFLQCYKISMVQTDIKFQDGEALALPFDMEYVIKAFTETRADTTLSDREIDRSTEMDGVIGNIAINLSKDHFAVLMKCLKENLTFDDKMEEHFNFTKKNLMKSLEGNLIFKMALRTRSLSLDLYNSTVRQHFTKLGLDSLQFSLESYDNSQLELAVTSDFNISHSKIDLEKIHDEETLKGYYMNYGILENQEDVNLEDLWNSPFEPVDILQLKYSSASDGSQKVFIDLKNPQIEIDTEVFLNIANVFVDEGQKEKAASNAREQDSLEDDLDYVANRHKKELTPRLDIEVTLKAPLIYVPTSDELGEAFCLTGDYTFYMVQNASKTVTEELDRYNHAAMIGQKCSPTQISNMRLIISELEVFRAPLREINNERKKEPKDMIRRTLIEPFQIFFNSENSESLSNDRVRFNQEMNNRIHIEVAKIFLSYSDLVVIQRSSEAQAEMATKFEGYTNPVIDDSAPHERTDEMETAEAISSTLAEPKRSSLVEESKDDGKPKNQPANSRQRGTQTNDIVLSGIQFILLNDFDGFYYPILHFATKKSEISLTKDLSENLMNLKSEVILFAQFYNLYAGYWEPFLEETAFSVDITNQDENKDQVDNIKFVFLEPVNINVSNEFLSVLNSTLERLSDKAHRMSEFQKMGTSQSDGQQSLLSPFVIRNHSAFSVLVERDPIGASSTTGFDTKPMVIEPGISHNYDTEIDEYKNLDPFELAKMHVSHHKLTVTLMREYAPPVIISRIDTNHVNSRIKEFESAVGRENLLYDIAILKDRKVLTIKGPISVYNKTLLDLHFIVVQSGTKGGQPIPIQAGAQKSIPALTLNAFVQVGNADQTQWGHTIIMEDLRDARYDCVLGEQHVVVRMERMKKSREYILHIEAPLIFRNALPFPISFRLSLTGSGSEIVMMLEKEQEYEEYQVGMTEDVTLSVQVPGFSWNDPFHISHKLRAEQRIKVKDDQNQTLNLRLHAAISHKADRFYTLYTTGCILNTSEQPLKFYYEKDESFFPVPADSMVSPVITKDRFDFQMMSLEQSKLVRLVVGNSQSRPISLKGAGLFTSLEIREYSQSKEKRYQFALSIDAITPTPNDQIITKVLTVGPRFLLINQLTDSVWVIQEGSKFPEVQIDYGQHTEFHCLDFSSPQRILIAPLEGESKDPCWRWSCSVPIGAPATNVVKCRHREDPNRVKFIRIRVVQEKATSNVFIEEMEEADHLYRIDNNSKTFSVRVFQMNYEQFKEEVDFGSNRAFAWDEITGERKLGVEFSWGPISEGFETLKSAFVDLDKINSRRKIAIYNKTVGHEDTVIMKIKLEGNTKVLKIYDRRSWNRAASSLGYDNPTTLKEMAVIIPNIGISIIKSGEAARSELLYLSLTQCKIGFIETNVDHEIGVKVDAIQVDNQAKITTLFPVVLCPQSQAKGKQKEFLNLAITKRKQTTPDLLHFPEIECLIQAMFIKMEEDFLNELIEYFGNLSGESTPDTTSGVTTLDGRKMLHNHPLFQKDGDHQKTNAKIQAMMEEEQEKTRETKIFIEELALSPIKSSISFKKSKTQTRSNFTGTVANAFGVALLNIEDSKFNLNAIQIDNAFGTSRKLVDLIASQYKSNLTLGALSLLGSSEFFGNPVGLVTNIGTGVKDFFYEPIDGIVKGNPLDFGKGVLKGTGSLVQKTVSGAFGTVSKVTGSIATGISTLSNDQEYLEQRERDKISNKPKHVVEGIGLGLKSFASGVVGGVTGVVNEPVKAAKQKKGAVGFFKGVGKGLAGLVVKPVTGALDVATKTAEGIKNTAHIFDKDPTKKRARDPRVFYGQENYFKAYNLMDAKSLVLMESHLDAGMMNTAYIASHSFENAKEKCVTSLVMLGDRVLLMKAKDGKIFWEAGAQTLVMARREGFFLHLQAHGNVYSIKFVNETDIKTTEEKFNTYLEYLNHQPC